MNKAKILIFSLFLFVLLAMIQTGNIAPAFKVMDGNKNVLQSSSLRGKVIVGFYENRHKKNLNTSLKKFLHSFHAKSRTHASGKTFKLAVIDATESNIAVAWIWRRNMRKATQTESVHVYGDWDGSMKKSFGFPENSSTFLIIDKKGYIAYVKSGKIQETEFQKIQRLIKRLTISK